jgi:anti-sigma factor RsiW
LHARDARCAAQPSAARRFLYAFAHDADEASVTAAARCARRARPSRTAQVPGLLKVRYIGRTTVTSAAIFGLFLGAGSLLQCGRRR